MRSFGRTTRRMKLFRGETMVEDMTERGDSYKRYGVFFLNREVQGENVMWEGGEKAESHRMCT